MYMKKRVVKGKGKDKVSSSALSGAINDLSLEIRSLSKEKSNLKNILGEVLSNIDVDHGKEKELQEKIAKLIEKEASLNQKKKDLQTKIEKVSDKMNKITKIKSEMSDV